MLGDWDGGDEVAGWPPDAEVLVPVVPGYLTARDASWCPDGDGFDPGFMRGRGGVAETMVTAVDDVRDASGDVADRAVLRELAVAVDQQSWLVVPDEAASYGVVRDERGRLVSTVAGVAPGGDLAGMVEQLVSMTTLGSTSTIADAAATGGTPAPNGVGVSAEESVAPAATSSGAAALTASAGTPVVSGLGGVGDHELGEVVAACQRLASWARGTQAAAIAELSGRAVMQPLPSGASFGSVSAQASTALEITDPLKLTSGQARNLVAESVELIEVFPATHAALSAGVVDERRARVILAELRTHEPDVAHLVEATVLAQAASLNATQLRRKIKALLLRLAPVTSEERHARAREDRHVRFNPGEDGMVWFEGLLPAEDAAALKAVLEAGQQSLKRRDTAAGEARARTADQRRADTLAYLAWTALSNGRITGPPPGTTHRDPDSTHSDPGSDTSSDAGGAAHGTDEAGDPTDASAADGADGEAAAAAATASGSDVASDAEAANATGPSATHSNHAAEPAGEADAGTAQTAADANEDSGDDADAAAPDAAVVTAEAADAHASDGTDDDPNVSESIGEGAHGASGDNPVDSPPEAGSPFGNPREPTDAGAAGGACRACGGGLKLASAHGRPVTVNVTIPLSTLLGLDEYPGHLDGYGPIPAHIARHLSTAGLWRWVATHDITGAILNHGRTRYTPTQDLIDHVILRDRTCRAPGCDAPAEVCELDHSIYWPHGPTAACNLGLFCKQHHLQKHHTRWRIEQPEPGVFHWISPTGRIITTHTPTEPQPPPETRPPDGSPPEPEPEPPPEPAHDTPPF